MQVRVESTTDQEFRDKFVGAVFPINLSNGLGTIQVEKGGAIYEFSPTSLIREDGKPLTTTPIVIGDILIFSSPVFVVRTEVVLI